MPYADNGNLLTESEEIAVDKTISSNAEWEAYAELNNIEITNNSIQLSEFIVNGLVGIWYGDEGSGNELIDSQGSNDFTINGPTWVSESSFKGGYGLEFDRSNNQYCSGGILQPSEFTWIIRVLAGSLGSGSPTYRVVIGHSQSPFLTYDVGSEEWRFEANNNDVRLTDSQAGVESGSRILVCRKDDGTDMKLSVYDDAQNLVNEGSTANSNSTSYDSNTTYIGQWEAGESTRQWDGLIDPNFHQVNRYIDDNEVESVISNEF